MTAGGVSNRQSQTAATAKGGAYIDTRDRLIPVAALCERRSHLPIGSHRPPLQRTSFFRKDKEETRRDTIVTLPDLE